MDYDRYVMRSLQKCKNLIRLLFYVSFCVVMIKATDGGGKIIYSL
jgi:hypothetical protein